MSIFPVQLTTCRIGNLTRLIHTLAMCDHAWWEQARFLEQVKVSQHMWKAAKAVECFAEVWGIERSAGMKKRCGG